MPLEVLSSRSTNFTTTLSSSGTSFMRNPPALEFGCWTSRVSKGRWNPLRRDWHSLPVSANLCNHMPPIEGLSNPPD